MRIKTEGVEGRQQVKEQVNRHFHFHINCTNVITPVKQKKLEFFLYCSQQATSSPSPYCLVDQAQIQQPTLVVATEQMPNHT